MVTVTRKIVFIDIIVGTYLHMYSHSPAVKQANFRVFKIYQKIITFILHHYTSI